MSNIKTHKDLEIWQKGIKLVELIYNLNSIISKRGNIWTHFSNEARSNILSEQSGRGSSKVFKKRIHSIVYIALGTLSELETQVIISLRLGYHNDPKILDEIEVLRKMTLNFIKYLKKK